MPKKKNRNKCCAKGEKAVNLSTVTRWFKKCCSACKNCNDQEMSREPKTVDFAATFNLFRQIRGAVMYNYWLEYQITHEG